MQFFVKFRNLWNICIEFLHICPDSFPGLSLIRCIGDIKLGYLLSSADTNTHVQCIIISCKLHIETAAVFCAQTADLGYGYLIFAILQILHHNPAPAS